MRTYLAIALGMTVLVCGCVSKTKYDEALAANRRINLELEKNRAELRTLMTERENMETRLTNAEGLLKSKEADIKILENANTELKAKFDEMATKYEDLLTSSKVPAMGPISLMVLPEQVDKALQEFAKANPDLAEYLPQYGMVKLKADLTFEPGSDYVQQSAQTALKKFTEILQSQQARAFNVFIAGHTDDMRIAKPETKRRHPDNWYLSAHRAVAVQQVLTEAGLAPERVCAMGFGEYHPVEPNKPGKKGNKANRRVEIWIVSPERFLTTPLQPATAPEPGGK